MYQCNSGLCLEPIKLITTQLPIGLLIQLLLYAIGGLMMPLVD